MELLPVFSEAKLLVGEEGVGVFEREPLVAVVVHVFLCLVAEVVAEATAREELGDAW